MPLRAAQLFVRCKSLEELGEALGRALDEKPLQDQMLLALHEDEWGTVVGDAPPDAGLARALSEQFGTVLSLELDGAAFLLRVQNWESGQPGDETRDPRPPAFRDVEAIAWELLGDLGVPPALRLLRLEDVEVLRDRSAWPAILARGGALFTVSAVPPPRPAGDAPPAEPGVLVESQAGEARALEVRVLPLGIPTEAWAASLVAIEESQGMRILRALGSGDQPRMPRPTFTYKSPQALRAGKLVDKARLERPWLVKLIDPERPPPLTLAGFTQACRPHLTGLEVVRAFGPHLEIQGPRACVRAPVAKIYDVYLSTLDELEAALQLAAETRALVETPGALLTPGQLLPTLLAGDAGNRVVRSFAPDLSISLLCDDGVRIQPVTLSGLLTLGQLSFDDALERAVQNVDALTDAAPEGIQWFDLEHGRVVSCEFSDAGGAGRLLSRHVRELILTILGEETALAAAPTRDSLLACAAGDEDGAAWLREEARSRYHEGPFPIAPVLFHLTADDLHPVADVGAGGSDEGEEPQP